MNTVLDFNDFSDVRRESGWRCRRIKTKSTQMINRSWRMKAWSGIKLYAWKGFPAIGDCRCHMKGKLMLVSVGVAAGESHREIFGKMGAESRFVAAMIGSLRLGSNSYGSSLGRSPFDFHGDVLMCLGQRNVTSISNSTPLTIHLDCDNGLCRVTSQYYQVCSYCCSLCLPRTTLALVSRFSC